MESGQLMSLVLAAVWGYLCGSVPFGLILTRLFGLGDFLKGRLLDGLRDLHSQERRFEWREFRIEALLSSPAHREQLAARAPAHLAQFTTAAIARRYLTLFEAVRRKGR